MDGNATQHATYRELDLYPSMYDDTVRVNAAVQINVLNYNAAIRCRRPTSMYNDVRSVNGA